MVPKPHAVRHQLYVGLALQSAIQELLTPSRKKSALMQANIDLANIQDDDYSMAGPAGFSRSTHFF
jgi:hypothetical protein